MVEIFQGLFGAINFGRIFGAMLEYNNSPLFPLYYKS
jgi:hypothetical protein